MASNMIKVIVADDHELFRDGIIRLLNKQKDMDVVAEASNGEQLVQLTQKHLPDVVVMDIQMPVMGGIEAARVITAKFPATSIIALSMIDNPYIIAEVMDAGAIGYLLKGAPKLEMLEGIRAVSKNETYYCSGTTQKIANALGSQSIQPGKSLKKIQFTHRQKQLMQLICQGLSGPQISQKLNLSERTIEGYRIALLAKTGCHNSAHLVFFIMQNNLL
jgi:DNA-binding NarL/FixJ family response regulator